MESTTPEEIVNTEIVEKVKKKRKPKTQKQMDAFNNMIANRSAKRKVEMDEKKKLSKEKKNVKIDIKEVPNNIEHNEPSESEEEVVYKKKPKKKKKKTRFVYQSSSSSEEETVAVVKRRKKKKNAPRIVYEDELEDSEPEPAAPPEPAIEYTPQKQFYII